MSIFKIVYSTGAFEYVSTDATTTADQTMRTFGMTEAQAAEFGASIELMPEDFEMVPGMNTDNVVQLDEDRQEESVQPDKAPPPENAPGGTEPAVSQVTGHTPTITQTTTPSDAPPPAPPAPPWGNDDNTRQT